MLRKLIEHLRWADVLILEALYRTASPPADAVEIYGHIVGAEHVWLARIHQREAQVAVWPSVDLGACATLAKENAAELEALVNDSNADLLASSVRYRNSADVEFETAVEDIILHVAMHGQYHRAQVNLLLRQAGLQPAPVDYIAFIRGAPAATRQP